MAYVKIDEFDSNDVTSLPSFHVEYSVNDAISRISRLGGYLALLATSAAVLGVCVRLI